MKQKHRCRPYTCSIQRQQRVDFSRFFPAFQLIITAIFGGSFLPCKKYLAISQNFEIVISKL